MADKILDYYKRAPQVDKVVRGSLKDEKEEVVYGARSVNVRLPEFLRKYTEDWDVYSISAEQTAREMEKDLDTYFGGDYFEVKPALHEGTFKVVSKVTGRGVADITIPEDVITYQTIDGVRYATLDEQVKNIKKSLADPESRFRHARDRETLQRIVLFREYYGRGEDGRVGHRAFRKRVKPKKKSRRTGGLVQILAEFRQ